MKRVLLIVLILVGFTGIKAQLCAPYSGTPIAAGATVCISSDIPITDLQIPKDATVIVKTGVNITGDGEYDIHGKFIFESNASLDLVGNLTLGAANENPLIVLGTKAAVKIEGDLTQSDVTGGGVYPTTSNQIQMSGSSILEVCMTYTNNSVTYAPITYTGSDPVKYPAYFLVKGTANGAGPGSIISNTAGINFFSPNPLNNITAGNATILSAANLPTGATTDTNTCDDVIPIRNGLPNPGFCVSGCNDNTFINADDPNTIEYDNLMAGFHATIAKLTGSQYEIWGQTTAADGVSDRTVPTLISPANGYTYTGTPLRATIGSYAGSSFASIRHQFFLLTTEGLYGWGRVGTAIHSSLLAVTNFTKLNIPTYGGSEPVSQGMGLPKNVMPQDVKMLFANQGTLALVTCDGQAWILSTMGKKFADGVDENDDRILNNNTLRLWHRVSTAANTPLQDVVAMRGTPYAMMALTSKGEVYTWGTGAYLGNGNAKANITYATKMTLPSAAFTPKMIGMTYSSDYTVCTQFGWFGCTKQRTVSGGVTYYVLGTNNQLYSLGNNAQRQLGVSAGQNDATYAAESRSWVMPIKGDKNGNSTGQPFNNIAWFSPNEHDGAGNAAINVITVDKDPDGTLHHYLYAWGSNDGSMTGTSGETADPTFMPGQLKTEQNIIAVATGGHISIAIQECVTNYGYVGHRTNGSMGDGTEDNQPGINKYNFADTSVLQLCGAAVAPKLNGFVSICPGTKINLNTDVFIGKIPAGATLVWYTTATRDAGTRVTDPTAVSAGNYWAFYEGFVTCGTPPGSEATITEYTPGSTDYKANCACFNPPTLDGSGQPTQVGISLLQRGGANNGNWPMNRKSGFIALESNTKGFVPTRMSTAQINAISNPVDGMMVYNTNENCLQIYVSGSGWKCFDKPACP